MVEDVMERAEQQFVSDVLDTPELETPPATPDAHRAVIDAVTLERADSGATAIRLALRSLDAGFETDYSIWLPKSFVDDVNLDPATLSEGEFNPLTGKIEGNERQQYRINVANSTKDAELQRLRAIAYESGRTLPPGSKKPANINEYVELLAHLLTGLEVIFIRRPDSKADDPRYRNRLRVKGIRSLADTNKGKAFKGYVKAWEQQ